MPCSTPSAPRPTPEGAAAVAETLTVLLYDRVTGDLVRDRGNLTFR